MNNFVYCFLFSWFSEVSTLLDITTILWLYFCLGFIVFWWFELNYPSHL